MKRCLVSSFSIIVAAIVAFTPSVASAIDEDVLDKFAANNIMFYDPEEENCKSRGAPSGITYIGDSLSESVLTMINERIDNVDTEEKEYGGETYVLVRSNKSMTRDRSDNPHGGHSGLTLLEALAKNNGLRSYVIFALGTNDPGAVTTDIADKVLSLIGEKTNIMFVTNFGIKDGAMDLYDQNNKVMKDYADKYDNVSVADWATAASSDPGHFIDNSDNLGVHLTSAGKDAFMDVIDNAIKESWSGGGKSSSGGSSGSLAGNNENYNGKKVWTDDELKKIEENRPTYEAAAAKYDIPWQAIATMHSLETGLALSNPDNGQGLYQLYSYTVNPDGSLNSNAFLPAGPIDQAEFARQTDIAAGIMKSIVDGAGLDMNEDGGVKYLLFQYNGRASQYIEKAKKMGFSDEEAKWGEGSPYVMNKYDARRDPESPDMDPLWPGRFCKDGVYCEGDTQSGPGGFVKYVAIGGGNGGGGTCKSNQNFGDLIETVKAYAWPNWRPRPQYEMMEDYKKAVDRFRSEGKYTGGASYPGIDCGGFVTITLIDSGFEPEYNSGARLADGASNITYNQLPWVQKSDSWELVNDDWNTPIHDESELSPGDVAFQHCNNEHDCGHTYMYVGEIEGFGEESNGTHLHIASSSYDERAPCAGYEQIFQDNGEAIKWYHKVK